MRIEGKVLFTISKKNLFAMPKENLYKIGLISMHSSYNKKLYKVECKRENDELDNMFGQEVLGLQAFY